MIKAYIVFFVVGLMAGIGIGGIRQFDKAQELEDQEALDDDM